MKLKKELRQTIPELDSLKGEIPEKLINLNKDVFNDFG